uniref:Uncharacterized protein n=1 Tax=Marseillevirus LCMAC103 TaxID=2506604 RepID=A0A481YV68_9VIRU|nr:MAG: uncharacterized protein LCMAC103_00140 [Marseillevirus LCMAC103]
MYVVPVDEEKGAIVTVKLQGAPKGICYNKAELNQWFNSQTSMKKWEAREGTTMDAQGYGGRPIPLPTFYRLPTEGWITTDAKNMIIDPKVSTVQLTSGMQNVRIGNPGGSFGVSQLHGQLPGVTIYSVPPTGTSPENISMLNNLIRNPGKKVIIRAKDGRDLTYTYNAESYRLSWRRVERAVMPLDRFLDSLLREASDPRSFRQRTITVGDVVVSASVRRGKETTEDMKLLEWGSHRNVARDVAREFRNTNEPIVITTHKPRRIEVAIGKKLSDRELIVKRITMKTAEPFDFRMIPVHQVYGIIGTIIYTD